MRQAQPNGQVAYKCGNIQVPVSQQIYFLRCVWYCTAVRGAHVTALSPIHPELRNPLHMIRLCKTFFFNLWLEFYTAYCEQCCTKGIIAQQSTTIPWFKVCISPLVSHVQPLLSHRIYKLTSSPTAVSHWAGTLLSFQGEWLLNTGLV